MVAEKCAGGSGSSGTTGDVVELVYLCSDQGDEGAFLWVWLLQIEGIRMASLSGCINRAFVAANQA